MLPSSGVLFLKSTLLFSYIAKLQSPHSHVANSTLVIWLFCKIAKSTSKMSFKLLTNQKIFWAVQGMNFLSWCAETSDPKKPDNPWFFKKFISTGYLHPAPPPFPFPSLSSLLIFVDLMTLWSLIGALSNSNYPLYFFWTCWEQICVNLIIAKLDSIVLILPSNNPLFFFSYWICKGAWGSLWKAMTLTKVISQGCPF